MSATIQKLPAFDPPGYPHVDDGLTGDEKKAWSEQISDWMNDEIAGPEGRTPLTQFFNGTVTAYDITQTPTAITWLAFPNIVQVDHDAPKRWELADNDRKNQDEYLEWSVRRNDQGQIISVVYSCEGPEYWKFLAEKNPKKLYSLYLEMNPEFKDKIKESDLYRNGKYNPSNKWNLPVDTGCIAHLAHRNNTLGAEIDIAAQGTVIRKDKNSKIITDKTKLINCSGYGQPDRNSDPKIGDAINGLTRKGNSISIANPVAIYMHSFNTGNFMLDIEGTGENLVDVPKGTFKWQRGNISKNMGLRLQIQIPDGVVGTGPDNKGQQLTLADIIDTSTGQNIQYGAQFTDYIFMTVKGVVIPGDKPAEPLPCPRLQARANGLTAMMVTESVDDTPCDASKNPFVAGTRR